MKRARRLGLLALAGIFLAGCALVTPNATPSRLTPPKALGLLDPTIPGTNGARVRFITQPVYLIDFSGHLTPSSRIVPSPPTLLTVLSQLLAGPSLIEASAGYSSALPSKLVLITATVTKNDVGYVDLATSLDGLSPARQALAVGQLVYTAYDVGATRGLVIEVDGVQQRVYTPSGTRTNLATEAKFATLLNS